MSVFTRGADGFQHTEVNRRDVLLAAGGMAAATALTGHAVEKKKAVPATSTLVIDDPDFSALEVLAWSWGASNSGTTHLGGGGGAGNSNVQDLNVTTYSGVNTPRLFLAVATGRNLPSATLTWVDKKGGHTTRIVMETVLVTSLSNGASIGSGPATDNVTFNFAKVTFSVDATSAVHDIAANS